MTPADDAIVLRDMTDHTPSVARPVESRAPVEGIAPRSSFDDPSSALEHFFKVRAATIEYVKTTPDDLRGHYIQVVLPVFPDIKLHDAYQWLLRMSAHKERHLAQVQEVKRTQGYSNGNN